jgi:16S rRNA (guanine527-N7)-methyltransferase
MNLIGKSTIADFENRHLKDCLQIEKFIDKDSKIADLGSGAGLPGILLSIIGVREVHLFEKSPKKCEFLTKASKFSPNKIVVRNENLHYINDNTFDIITSRAFACLDVLMDISKNLAKPNTKLIFLKGKKIYEEIKEAEKRHKFNYSLHESKTSTEGKIFIGNLN